MPTTPAPAFGLPRAWKLGVLFVLGFALSAGWNELRSDRPVRTAPAAADAAAPGSLPEPGPMPVPDAAAE